MSAAKDASAHHDGAAGTIDFTVTVGIATGQLVEFSTPTDSRDFVGNVADKSRRLCDAASPNAIFIDRATEAAANMMRIRSKLGAVMQRTADQYQGDVQRAPLKGFSQPVDYYEILWGQQLYGLKSEAVTDSTARFRPHPDNSTGSIDATRQLTRATAPHAHGTTVLRDDRRIGEVKVWPTNKDYCFLRDTRDGEQFFCPKSSITYDGDEDKMKTAGTKVTFAVKGPANETDKHRKALCVLVVGEYADGTVHSKPPGRDYAWVRCTDDSGNWQTVYLSQRPGDTVWAVGDTLSFRVGVNDRGAIAEEVTKADTVAA